MRESTGTQARGGAEEEGQADSPLREESDVGLDPRTLRSWLELNSGT